MGKEVQLTDFLIELGLDHFWQTSVSFAYVGSLVRMELISIPEKLALFRGTIIEPVLFDSGINDLPLFCLCCAELVLSVGSPFVKPVNCDYTIRVAVHDDDSTQ